MAVAATAAAGVQGSISPFYSPVPCITTATKPLQPDHYFHSLLANLREILIRLLSFVRFNHLLTLRRMSAKVGRSDCKPTFENGAFSANYLRLSDPGIFQLELLRGDKSMHMHCCAQRDLLQQL